MSEVERLVRIDIFRCVPSEVGSEGQVILREEVTGVESVVFQCRGHGWS